MISEPELYRILHKATFGYLCDQLKDGAQDALHDIYIRMLKLMRAGRLEDDSDRLRQYSLVAAMNRVRAELGKHTVEYYSGSCNSFAVVPSPEDDAIASEPTAQVLKAAESDPRAAELVRLMLAGYSVKEMAERFGITPRHLKHLKRRTLEAIRAALIPPH